MMGKILGTIVDIINSPLSAAEVTISLVLASITRGLCIAFISTFLFMFFLNLTIQNYFLWFLYLFLSGLFLGSAGIIAGLYADKFDQMATVTNFVIVPLSFLSGTFYSIDKLPDILKGLSYYNPFFHMIDGFRYSFIGQLDGSLKFGIIFLFIISLVTWYLAYLLFKKGYKIKT